MIERGEINPMLRVFYKLARGLELPTWEILKLADLRHLGEGADVALPV